MKFITVIFSIALLSAATAILPNRCSVQHCGTLGAAAPCTQTHPFKVTNCATWSTANEARLQCRALNCRNMSCYFIPLLASDGNLYCTPCHIHQVGCRTGFKVYGPVSGAVSRQVSEKVEDEDGEEENVSEMIEEPLSRQAKENLSTEVANADSEKLLVRPICSRKFCSKFGADARCRFILPQGGSADISCLKFSLTRQSREQCRFFCPLVCLPEDEQPVANTGRKFCNVCLLQQESCRTHYRVFGPVKQPVITPEPIPTPVVPECSVPFCTASGRSARCLLDSKPASCSAYAKTDAKRRACDFACIQICIDPDEQPVDNFGNKYCSVCHLTQASCNSDFKIFLVENNN